MPEYSVIIFLAFYIIFYFYERISFINLDITWQKSDTLSGIDKIVFLKAWLAVLIIGTQLLDYDKYPEVFSSYLLACGLSHTIFIYKCLPFFNYIFNYNKALQSALLAWGGLLLNLLNILDLSKDNFVIIY